jgi:KipI family sensor histidine kinase inhibitor
VLPLGEAAFTIRLGEVATVELAERSAALADAVRSAGLDGVTEVVSAVASVTVYLETADRRTQSADARAMLQQRLAEFAAAQYDGATGARIFATHTIPTKYDGADLDEVAERTGLARDDVILRHTAVEYHVLAIGFLPGWGYLGPLDASLALPRRASPRTRIPAGSVAIAGVQTGIYPRVSPGGWNLIGSTDAVLFDAERERPSLFRAGDRVRFTPVA